MRQLIIANWKCNPRTWQEARQLFNALKKGVEQTKNVEIVICPPFVYIPAISDILYKSRKRQKLKNFFLGSQDCFWEESGAFTGEISVLMLKDFGCQYVILGHSERRKYFQETDETINKKIKAAIGAGLKPILCVGETEEEKEKDETLKVIRNQIEKGLAGIGREKGKNLVIAYEPVWAINTGNACKPGEVKKVAEFLGRILKSIFGKGFGKKIPILYGGSVNSQNVRDFIKEGKVQGLLVGSASLLPKEFIEILKMLDKTFSTNY